MKVLMPYAARSGDPNQISVDGLDGAVAADTIAIYFPETYRQLESLTGLQWLFNYARDTELITGTGPRYLRCSLNQLTEPGIVSETSLTLGADDIAIGFGANTQDGAAVPLESAFGSLRDYAREAWGTLAA